MALQSINPATDALIERFDEHTPDEVARIVDATEEAFQSGKRLPIAERAPFMHKAAQLLRDRCETYGRTISLEMGKPIAESRAEVEKCAWVCDYYAQNAATILAREEIDAGYTRSYARFDPLGTVLAVMPWNFPFWQVFRFAAPALMARNTALLKHSSNVMRCALQIEEVFRDAGFDENAFRTLLIPSGPVEAVIDNPIVKAVTLTGSNPAGSAVAARAGRQIKKTVLELGGSDAFIVLADANLSQAAATGATARLLNCGQSCIAAKRFIVDRTVREEFVALLAAEFKKNLVGDPLDEAVAIGPMARRDLRDELDDQVKRSIAAGAEAVTGGRAIDGDGAFYAPTILTGVRPGMAAFDEETFGPVAAVIDADDARHAVDLANDSPFGLGGSLWTNDLDRGEALAARIESGAIFINDMTKSDPRLPFGGIKLSGYGRELSHYGIKEFVNIKTVAVNDCGADDPGRK